jgi:hypothetical protein
MTVRKARESAKVLGIRKGNVILYTQDEAERVKAAVATSRQRSRHNPA